MPSRRVALGSGDGWWEEETDPVRGIDQSLANASQLGKNGNQAGSELWLSCCSMIPEVARSKRTVAEQLASDPMLRESGLRGKYRNQFGPAVYMVQTRQVFRAQHAALPNPSIEGTSRAGALGRPSCQTLNIAREAVIAEVSTQLSE